MITPASFRLDFTEFGSQSLYPDSGVQFWITMAGLLLRVERWGNPGPTSIKPAPASTIYDIATELFVAHNLALEKNAQDAARRGGTPGWSTGPISAKSVGPVSQSYSVSEGLVQDAGFWNLTTFGTRFYWLMQMFGAGPAQVGVGCNPWGNFNGGGVPWVGPDPWPGQTSFG
jgi:uncharacterized protein DUF4054